MSQWELDTANYYLNRRIAHCHDVMKGREDDDVIEFVAREMADIRIKQAQLARTEVTKS